MGWAWAGFGLWARPSTSLIDAVALRMDLEVIHRDGVNLDALRLELNWHREYVDCKNKLHLITTKPSLDRKVKVLAALITAVECYNELQNNDSTPADYHSLDYVSEPNNVDMDEVTPGDNFIGMIKYSHEINSIFLFIHITNIHTKSLYKYFWDFTWPRAREWARNLYKMTIC
jgi:hypothetical protein